MLLPHVSYFIAYETKPLFFGTDEYSFDCFARYEAGTLTTDQSAITFV